MANYPSSAPVIDNLPLVPAIKSTVLCVSCGQTMKHLRTITRLGIRPETHIFVCPFCQGVDYKELRKVA
jgi:hypothetical protein